MTDTKRPRILIVDDEEKNLKLLGLISPGGLMPVQRDILIYFGQA